MLGNISWLGFGCCLIFLFAPCGCQRAYCGPHCRCESARVLASLLGPSSSRGLPSVSRLFLSWGPCRSRSLIPSLAPSWWCSFPLLWWAFFDALWLCPERALRLLFASVSLVDPVALSPLSCSVFADGFCHLCELALGGGGGGGASPHELGFVGALGGLAVAPPLSPYTGPGWSPPSGRMPLELRSVCLPFHARCSARIHGDTFVSFTDLYVSLPQHSHWVVFIGHLTRRVLGWPWCSPPRSCRTLSIALTSGHDSLILMHPAIDIVWRCP